MYVDVQYRERIIFLGKAIDEETGNQLVATMLYLDSENKKDLNLYINCSGGDVSIVATCMLMCYLWIRSVRISHTALSASPQLRIPHACTVS